MADHHHSHDGGGFDHDHIDYQDGRLDPLQQNINCERSVPDQSHHDHGGMDNAQRNIDVGGFQLHPGQQHSSHHPITVVDQPHLSDIQKSQFKRYVASGVILLLISLGIIAGAVTIGSPSVFGIPLLASGFLLLSAGIVFKVLGYLSYLQWRSQLVVQATVVSQAPSTVRVPPPSVISAGNITNTSAPYHQDFSTPQAPPSCSSK